MMEASLPGVWSLSQSVLLTDAHLILLKARLSLPQLAVAIYPVSSTKRVSKSMACSIRFRSAASPVPGLD